MPIGRISGPMLKENLIRQGVDLSFETDLLYLDVTNNRVGIKNSSPQYDLDVTGTARVVDLVVTNVATIGDIIISGNTIETSLSTLNLGTADNVVYQTKAIIDDTLQFENNTISTIVSNANIELRPNGTGSVEVSSDLNVTGNIHAVGNITADGNIQLGDNVNQDTVTFNAEITSDLIPASDNQYDIGSATSSWSNIWVDTFNATNIVTGNISVGNIDITLVQGNIYYVAVNGDNANDGNHPQSPYRSVEYALNQAVNGDTVYVFPGIYEETFPITVPAGVVLKGHNLRSVIIKPDSNPVEDAFYLNGDCTVEDITIQDFRYDSLTNTGYAFKFAPNASVTSRSPYIRNVTVITSGSVTDIEDPRGFNTGDAGRGVYADGSVVSSTSNEASMLFHSCTFITPGVDCVIATNGVRIEWLNCFTYFANRSVYSLDGTSGKYGIGKTKLRVDGLSGTYTVGETISYYDQDGTTLLASGTIDSIDIDGKISLTNKGTGEFLEPDVRGGKTVVINGDAQINTATKKYGIGSLQLDGVGDYLSINSNNDFGFGTGDFTVETWIYLNDLIDNQQIFDFRSGSVADISPVVYVSNGGQLQYYVYNSSRIIGTSLSSNTWYHIALVRDNGNTRLYVNGSQVGVTYTDTNDYGSTKPCTIGARFDGANGCNAFFDDFRVIKGQAAYTSNFTAPTFQLTVTAETVLMLRFDTAIDDDVIYAQDIRFSGGATATEFTLVDYREFGAEIRMIGSASVYGNYGLYGDGPGVLVYAIGHNLAYIGNGRHVTNDPTTVNQAREVTEINGAKIRYSSVDHKGDFRIGNLFHVNQDNGTVNFSASGINIDLTQAITITDGNSTTLIDSSQISTGNIVFSGNTVETTTGNLNILAATGLTTIQNTTNISGSVDITNNLTVGGSASIGDSASDTFTLTSFVDSDIIPNVSNLYSLGTSVNRWNNLYITEIYGENIQILDNTISTTTSNSDLELRAAGIGTIYVPNNNVQVDNDLTVYGTTTLSTTNITGTVTITSNITQTGDINQTGTTNVNQNLNVLGAAQFEKIEIVDNYISTTISGLNLELRASGLGKVLIPDNDAQINGNLNVLGAVTTTDYLITGFVEADRISTDNILINTNYITTTISNSDLELRANGTGRVTVLDNDFQAGQNLTVIGSSSLSDTTINGLLTVNGSINNTGNIAVTGTVSVGADLTVSKYAQFADIRIDGNVITTTLSNADLELRANGTGVVSIPESNVVVNNNMTVLGTATVNTVISNYSINTRELQTENIQIKDNFIATTLSNSDLELRAAGSGRVKLGSIEFISNQMFSSANMILDAASNFIEINGTGGLVLPRGNTAERQPLQGYGQIRYNTQLTRYEGYDGTNWFNLTGVEDLDGNTNIIANNNNIEFNINGATVATMDADFFTVPQIQVDNININGNVISNTDPAADMEINANGTGSVIIENFAFSGNNITNTVDGSVTVLNNTGNGYVEFPGTIGVVIPFGNTLSRGPAETGMIRYNTDDNRVEIYSGTEWTQLGGTGSGLNYAEATDIAVTMALIFG